MCQTEVPTSPYRYYRTTDVCSDPEFECPVPTCEYTRCPIEDVQVHLLEGHSQYETRYALLSFLNDHPAHDPTREAIESERSDGNPWNTITDTVAVRHHPILEEEMYDTLFGSIERAHELVTSPSALNLDGALDYVKAKKPETEPQPTQSERKKYGSDWRQIRQAIRERDDYQCRVCGIDREDITTLNVHHITPARTFDDYEVMNDSNNLVTLCPSCHGTFEGQWVDCDVETFVDRAQAELASA